MFRDRSEAGRRLGDALAELGISEPAVFGIPRGGVVVAGEVARRLDGDLDVMVTAKIRAPAQPELGLGAVGPDGSVLLDEETCRLLGVDEEYLRREVAERRAEIARRIRAYRGDVEPADPSGRPAVLVDDGIATGGTAVVGARALREMKPSEVILAVPVAPRSSLAKLEGEADRVVCLQTPEPFIAVGAWYLDFAQVSDEEVRREVQQGRR